MTIVAIDMETGDRKEIWRNTGPSLILHSIAVSPDGKALAMTLNREGWESPRLARLDVETKEYMELASSVAESMVAWTRDGRSILFAQVGPDEGRVMRVSVDDTRRLEFTGLVLSQSCGCGHTIDFNPDGSRIVFSDATREKNALYALENVSAALKSSR
jgi:dipeptidyl aminopeptidase/acylaminoacyl peptidase